MYRALRLISSDTAAIWKFAHRYQALARNPVIDWLNHGYQVNCPRLLGQFNFPTFLHDKVRVRPYVPTNP